MKSVWEKPKSTFDPSKGLLNNDQYHMGYVTNDLERAVQVFRDRYRVPGFRESDVETASGATIKVRATWLGNMGYEITWASGPGTEHYTRDLPTSGFVLRHHHVGFLIADDSEWQALEDEVDRGRWTVTQRSDTPGFGRTMFVEAPELGHYLEFVMPDTGLAARLDGTPTW